MTSGGDAKHHVRRVIVLVAATGILAAATLALLLKTRAPRHSPFMGTVEAPTRAGSSSELASFRQGSNRGEPQHPKPRSRTAETEQQASLQESQRRNSLIAQFSSQRPDPSFSSSLASRIQTEVAAYGQNNKDIRLYRLECVGRMCMVELRFSNEMVRYSAQADLQSRKVLRMNECSIHSLGLSERDALRQTLVVKCSN